MFNIPNQSVREIFPLADNYTRHPTKPQSHPGWAVVRVQTGESAILMNLVIDGSLTSGQQLSAGITSRWWKV